MGIFQEMQYGCKGIFSEMLINRAMRQQRVHDEEEEEEIHFSEKLRTQVNFRQFSLKFVGYTFQTE